MGVTAPRGASTGASSRPLAIWARLSVGAGAHRGDHGRRRRSARWRARASPRRCRTGPAQWPWATFVVNLAGAFILGWLLTRLAERTAPSRYWRFFAGTGFCGALTTFSTFQVETFEFARDGHVGAGDRLSRWRASRRAWRWRSAGVMVARWGRHW